MRVEHNRTLLGLALGVLLTGCAEQNNKTSSAPAATREALMAKDGPQVVDASVVLNEYAALAANVSAGAQTIQVTNIANLNSALFGNLEVGDLLMIIQMQGADIDVTDSVNYGNVTNLQGAGLHEFIEVVSINANTITLTNNCGGLKNSYTTAGRTQIVRVPQFVSLSVESNGTVTAPPWNGSTGGIVALHVRDTMTLSGSVDVQGLGFRGGSADDTSSAMGVDTPGYRSADAGSGGEKGEGIAGSQSTYDSRGGRYGRGAAANGGGGANSFRAGGGGGANATNNNLWAGQGVMDPLTNGAAAWALDPGRALGTSTANLANNSGGGRGGYSYSLNNLNATQTGPGNGSWGGNNRLERGGLGGRPLTNDALSRLFIGGGGGAGDGESGASGSGGRGGGLIYIMSDIVTGSGALVANGAPGGDTVGTHVDSAGGGGAGGAVVVRSNVSSGFSVVANGGNGGKQRLDPGQDPSAGPGGGGSGGFIAMSAPAPTRSVAGGDNGETTSNGLTEFPANGATRGASGATAVIAAVMLDGGVPVAVVDTPLCLEPADLSITKTNGATTSVPGLTTSYTITARNNGPNAVTKARIVDQVPSQFTGTVNWSCTSALGTCSPTSGTGSINAGASPNAFFSLPSGATAVYTVTGTINSTATGSMTNSASVFSPPVVNDPLSTNNVAVDTDVLGPVSDLGLDITATPSPVDEDSTITWTVRVANPGPSQAAAVAVTFNLPATTEATFGSASGSGWSCSRAGTVVTCTRSAFAVSANLPISIVGTVLLAGGTLNWSGSVSTTSTDSNSGNNSVIGSTPVESVNDAPVNTVPGAQTTPEDGPKVFSISNGNSISVDDVDIGTNNFEITLQSTAGTLTLGAVTGLAFSDGDGTADTRMIFIGPKGAINAALNGLTFTPVPEFNGLATLRIVTSDLGNSGKGGNKVAQNTINITVSPVNDAPTPSDDFASGDEDTATMITVLGNDSSAPDGPEVLSVIGFPQAPAHGTIQGGGTTSLIYTPAPNYFGPDSFTYTVSDGELSSVATVSVTVLPVNDPPTATDDNDVGVPEGSSNNLVNVLANDSVLPDLNESLSVVAVTQPAHGTAAFTSTGVTYTPSPGYNGSDVFTYSISDGALTSSATVRVNIGPANRPPINDVPGAQLIEEDSSLTFDQTKRLTVSDPDAAAGQMQITLVVTNGVLSLGGNINPLAFALGDGTNDATMTFTGTIDEINAALLDTVFTPTPNFNGPASLQMVSNDLGNTGIGGAKTDVDTVTITVAPVNDLPTAAPDTVTVAEDSVAERIEPLGNDSFDPDSNEVLRIIAVGPAAHGTTMLVAGGERLTYTPEPNTYGADTFTYTITDGNGGLATGTITVNVLNVNDPPTATPDLFSLTQDSTDNFLDVLANDTYLPDPFEVLEVVVVSPVSHGTLTISSDGSGVIYTPSARYIGPDAFTYTVRDANGGFAATVVSLTIGADTDRDGLSDDDENGFGTNPLDADTDDDGLTDGVEVKIGMTNPLDDDSDDDGLLDGNEDTNRNGVRDANETDNKVFDTDGDTLSDGLERGLSMPQGRNTKLTVFRADLDPTTQTNPLRPDTDSGGDFDYIEDANLNGRIDAEETDPNNPLDDRKDFDNDGLTDALEISVGLDPNDADTDDDGVVDGTDGLTDTDSDGLIDAIDTDSDNDGLLDGTEAGVSDDLKPRDTDVSAGHFVPDLDPSSKTNPKASESDGDGLKDGEEDTDKNGRHDPGETDASKPDTDDDGLSDGLEKKAFNPTNPELADSDNDGLLDGQEDVNANGKVETTETDPNIADTDGGGALDGAEVERKTDPLNKIDDYEARGGGGCSSVPGTWALLGLLVVFWRRQKVTLAVLLAVTSSSAFAQNLYNTSIDVQRFKPGVGSQDFLNVESARVAPHLTPFAGVFIGYANTPLVLGVPGTNQNAVALVNDLTFFDLSFGVALKDHLELAVALPMSVARGQSASSLDPSLGSARSGFAAGDLRFVPKYSFFNREQVLQVAVSMPLVFPTGNATSFRGGGAVLVAPRALVELNMPIFRVVANLGFNLRTAEMRLMNMTVGQEFVWATGGEFPLFGDLAGDDHALLLQGSVTGAVGLKKLTRTDVPVDLMAGLKYRIGSVMAFEVAGGAGLTHGWANPKYQVVFGFSYQHAPIQLPESWFQKEAPALVVDDARYTKPGSNPDEQFVTRNTDAAVPTPNEPAAAAKPEPVKFLDADRDGVADATDKCPDEKEVINGIADDDGCADKGDVKVSIKSGKLTFKGKIDFQTKRASLTNGAESLVKQLAAVLRANPDAKLRVDVYVTDLNTLDENNAMSAQRAATVRELLIREGVERRRIQTRALGMGKPLEPSAVELMLL